MVEDDSSRPAPPKPPHRPKAVHAERAAAALRDNLRRRKAADRKADDKGPSS
jgi:hypothetical protein